jgi:membrane fusion protein, copper/silver efflux system
MKNKVLIISITLIAGIFLGWLIFHRNEPSESKNEHTVKDSTAEVWTCSMHPQIRKEGPGKCPICGMDLILLSQSAASSADPDEVRISGEAAALADVVTYMVTRKNPSKEVRLYGKVQADERFVQSQVAHISGRIERLYVNFTGENVSKGQLLARIYSPELVTGQQELIEASRSKQLEPGLYEASKQKLRLWKLTDEQIASVEESGIPQNSVDVYSNTKGIVTERGVNTGDYVSQGTVLFEISDLSKVWILFDAYESDIQFLKTGENVAFSVQALPGERFSGKISFIDPFIDPVTRVARVRVEADNSKGKLKPEMFASGIFVSDPGGKKDEIVIPASSVLWTGKRSVVYVKLPSGDGPAFKMREIELGQSLGEEYTVVAGLSAGEEIVTNGAFYIDAAAQLSGKNSMMNSLQTTTVNITKEAFNVSGNCEMCKERVEKTSLSVKGVSSASWDVKTKSLTIEYDHEQTDLKAVAKAIADAGHDNQFFTAPDSVYNALPECCLYRK